MAGMASASDMTPVRPAIVRRPNASLFIFNSINKSAQ
jgi:hypothetical protein